MIFQSTRMKFDKIGFICRFQVTYTHWLMKSEPESRLENGIDVKFGLEDLKASKDQTACWDGVRNYEVEQFSILFDLVLSSTRWYRIKNFKN